MLKNIPHEVHKHGHKCIIYWPYKARGRRVIRVLPASASRDECIDAHLAEIAKAKEDKHD